MKRTFKFIFKAWLLYAFSMLIAGYTIADANRREREALIAQSKASLDATNARLKQLGVMK